MESQESQLTKPGRDNWIFFSALVMFGVLVAGNGKLLLSVGFLLLAVFTLANNPLKLDPIPNRPAPLLVASWLCGLAGIAVVLTAAVGNLA